MKLPHRGVHLDCHTLPAAADVGLDFDADRFADTLAAARVDFINVFAKCNLGMAYYPTKVGVVHPSLKRDLLGEMVEACHARDIAVAAYFNAGLDHEMALRHRDWAILGDDGRVYGEDHLEHFFRTMCFTGPWADHLVAMIGEVLDDYEIDGLILDCWAFGRGCQGMECAEAMRGEEMDPTDPQQRAAFQDSRKLAFVDRVREMIEQKRPEAGYYLNGVPFEQQLEVCSHLEIESLPCGGWGYDNFPVKVRYLRTRRRRDGSAVHLVGQTGRFHLGWGDFGGLRTQAGLDYDCYQAISHAVACGIGDHLHPRGTMHDEAYRRIGSIYERIEALAEWTDAATALTDTAIIASFGESVSVGLTEDQHQTVGATRALAELQHQFDVITPNDDWSNYRTLVLLDGVRLGDDQRARVRAHLDAGGAVLSTGAGGMAAERDAFAPEWGIEYVGAEPWDPHYVCAEPEFCPEATDPLTVSAPAVAIRAGNGTQTLAQVIQPYFSRHWDGFHGHVYNPPDQPTGRPAITRCGGVTHFAGAMFTDYADNANPLHRQLIGAALPSSMVRVTGLPSFARVTLTQQGERVLVHLLAYVPERRGRDLEVIEEPIVLQELVIQLRRSEIKQIYLAPSREPVEFAMEDDCVRFTVYRVIGYQMIVIE